MNLLPGILDGWVRAPLRLPVFPALVVCLALCAASPAPAQDQGGDQGSDQGQGENPTPPAPEQHDSFIDRLKLNPTYNSSVSVNRTQTQWDQGFTMSRSFQRLKADNSWSMSLQRNSAQNDYRSRQGSTKTRLAYDLPGFGGWSAGTEFNLKRTFAGSHFDRTVSNGNSMSVFVTSEMLGRVLHQTVGVPKDNLSWTVTGSDGVTTSSDIRQRWNAVPNSPLMTKTNDDSTTTSGAAPALDTAFQFTPNKAWKIDASGHLNSSNEDSRTASFQPNRPQAVDVSKNTNRDKGARYGFSSAWAPDADNRVNFSASYANATNQYYQNYGNILGQETKKGIDQRLTLDVNAVPLWGVALEFKGESALTSATFRLSDQDRGLRKNDVGGTIKFTTGPGFGLFQKTELNTEWYWESSRNTAKVTPDYDYKERRLRQNLRHPFGSKVVFMVTGEGSLGQSFYDDRSLDRDELRWLADGALGYRPSKILDTRLTAQYSQRKTVNIPASNSAQSNTQDTYRIGAELNCPITPNVKISQKYTITADYSFYDFNEDSNGLVRTSEVRTGLDSTVGSKVKLQLDHDYRFKDSGKYVRQGPGLPRAYSKATLETFQYITVTTSYAFSDEFDVHSSERMEARRTSPVPQPGKKITTTIARKLEFRGGLSLDHKFGEDFTVQASVDNVRSTAEPQYWYINASLNRKF